MDQQIEMERAAIEDRWLWNIKVLGQIVGLWPYQEKSVKYCSRCIIIFLMSIANGSLIARIVKYYSIDVLTDQIPFMLLGFGCLIKHLNYMLNEKRVRTLLNVIVSDFMEKRPKEEMEILELYTNKAHTFGAIYKTFIIVAVSVYLCIPLIPPILDIVAPLNKSRDLVLLVPAYYFVDEQRFYTPILSHMIMCAIIIGAVFICCDLHLTHLIQHGCALLGITGYRFKHAMDGLDLHEKEDTEFLMNRNFAQVIECIKAHKKTNEYVKILEAIHVYYFAIGIFIIIVAFTVSFVKLATLEIGSVFITFAVFTVGQVLHIAFVTVLAQFLSNSGEEFFQNICEAQWYNGSMKSQTLYLLVLRQCLSSVKLTAGGVIEMNLACCVQILKASFSYYTVLSDT